MKQSVVSRSELGNLSKEIADPLEATGASSG